MASMIVSKRGWAFVCAMVVLIGNGLSLEAGEGQEPSAGNQYGDETLWKTLNDDGLKVDAIDGILTGVDDNSGTRVGRVTVERLLDYKIMDLKYCQADKMAERRLDKLDIDSRIFLDNVSGYERNIGVLRFARHYLLQLQSKCIRNYAQVLEAAIERIDPGMREHLRKYAYGEGSYLWQLRINHRRYPDLGSEEQKRLLYVEASCRKLNEMMLFTNSNGFFNSQVVSPHNEQEILGDWYQSNKLCREYLNCCTWEVSSRRQAFEKIYQEQNSRGIRSI